MFSTLRNRSLLALCLAAFSAYTGAGMVTTVRVLFIRSHGGSLAIISASATAFLVANFACQYPWGWLADRWGRKQVLLLGLLAQAAISGLYLAVPSPAFFVVLRLFDGAAAASVLPAARAAVADLFSDEHRGRAYGTFTAFFNCGFLVGPALGGFLAGIGFASVFLVAVALRLSSALLIAALLPNTRPAAASAAGGDHSGWRELTRLPLLAAYLIAFGDYLWIGFDMTLAPLWLRHHLGATLLLIGITYSAWALPGTLLVPLGGRLADRFSRGRLILVFGLAQLPMYLLYAAAHSIGLVIAGFCLQASFYAVVSPALDAHVARSSPPGRRGRVQSTYSACGIIGALAGASAFVPLYAIDYRLPLLAQGMGYGMVILAGGFAILLTERRERTKVIDRQLLSEDAAVAALQ